MQCVNVGVFSIATEHYNKRMKSIGMDAFIRLGLRSTSKQRRSKLSLSNFESVRGVHRKEGFLASTGRGGTGLQVFGSGGRNKNNNSRTPGQGEREKSRGHDFSHIRHRSDEQMDHPDHHHEVDDDNHDHDLLSVIEEADSMLSASQAGLLAPLQVTPPPTTTTTTNICSEDYS